MNKYQTQLTAELTSSLPKEVLIDLNDYLSSVAFIKHLVSDERGYAKDRPRMTDEDGQPLPDNRIEVDLTKPHMLEDMDFFRERALFFNKHGKYTHLTPNANPKSEYGLFWKEELRRWKHGIVRPSDGEWIPGELYFYWNYCPIWLVEKDGLQGKGSKKARGKRLREFPKPWLGDYLFHHYIEQAKRHGQHGKLLKTRGVGFSFKVASWSPRNMYVFPGSGNPNFHLASDKTFLSGDKGIWGKVLDCLDWIGSHTPLPKLRLVDGKRQMEVQLGYEDEYGARKGLLSSVFGISMKHDPDKARGIRGPLIHYEEDGLFPDLEKAWNVNRKAVEDGDVSFGFMLAGGTGGTEGASFEGSEKLFYKPGAYNIYGLSNVFDKGANPEKKCGFFWGAYMNRNGCYDQSTGEPDVIKALIEILLDRYEVKKESSDGLALTQKKAEEPITPQEAVMRISGTKFPVSELKMHLSEVEVNPAKYDDADYIGRLLFDSEGEVIWKPDDNLEPIRKFPHSGNKNMDGCIIIHEMPYKDGEGRVPYNLYIAGIDPYDHDESTTNSLGSCFIMNVLTERIVAEYTGRPTATEFYENCRKLLIFYNAIANYENALKGLYVHFENKNSLHLLCEQPKVVADIEQNNTTAQSRRKGTPANERINSFGRTLIAEWLNKPISPESETKMLYKLRSKPLIEELIGWNIDGNFDRVSAMGMLMILRQDRSKIEAELENATKTLSSDPYWNKHKKPGQFSYTGELKFSLHNPNKR